ncbi:3-keto-steroid reductase [Westerdykella ornata]|uniref:3-keto-steroid reductase n=1 Tax=Westerdykella ornata TaxID=318751 RepID=A0A6A6J5A4_WESOR|nr:3-keto-steroid reductase [Westerdykella ornata]KAF2271572.1 3-keto-steroid reductase [Westerdykella ornata]
MHHPGDGFYVVITGANSGLGLGIGCRLIDEFLQTRPLSESLVLIITTRDRRKGDATIVQLKKHLAEACRRSEKTLPRSSPLNERRVQFRNEILDLTSLISVQELSKRLRDTTPKLDVVICNAGIGGWEDMYWGRAVWSILTDWRNAVTWPTFKKSRVGWLTKPQIPNSEQGKKVEEPALGRVFCANLFGHYLLGHYLGPLLERRNASSSTRGRLIWVSSVEAYAHTFDINDMQGLASTAPYESTKRQTDLMGITSVLPSTAPLVNQYLDRPKDADDFTKPRIYVAHPGICGTGIFPMNFVFDFLMLFAFYMARWMGSPWHPVTAYKGAVAMVWLALAKQSLLDTMEAQEGVGKWGSATDWWGRERVERTEVEGWGWGGKLGESTRRKGRSPYAKALTEESRREFVETGRKCWEEMERLRVEWEGKLEQAGVGVRME